MVKTAAETAETTDVQATNGGQPGIEEVAAAHVEAMGFVRKEEEPDEPRDFAVFDIETGPLPDDQLRALCPEFVPPPHPGEFDAAAVKYGNTKDPAKRKAKLEESRAAHAAAVKNYGDETEKARAEWFGKFKEKAALDATTGSVVAIGIVYPNEDRDIINCDGDGDGDGEADGLRDFWKWVGFGLEANVPIIGFNTHGFDLPFLVRRSWILGVPVPAGVRQGRYWNSLFIDIAQEWEFGGYGRGGKLFSLNAMASWFDLGQKVAEVDGVEVSGVTFYQLWRDPERRSVAEKYLLQDLNLPAQIAVRMGVV